MVKTWPLWWYQLWARSGKALGYLYAAVDRHAAQFPPGLFRRKLRGNVQMDCSLRDHVQRQIYFFGAYEPLETALLTSLFDSDSVAIDAGANVGFYSLMMARSAQQGRVLAFEPVPSNYQKLQHNISLNSNVQNLSTHCMGLWHQDSELIFSLESDMGDNIGSFTAGEVIEAESRVRSPVRRLDDILREQNVNRVDFIKMDIEGAEKSALQGAQQTLEKYRPSLLLEINRKAAERFHYPTSDLFQFLSQWDYRFYRVGHDAAHSEWINSFDSIEQGNVLVISPRHFHRLAQNWDAKSIQRQFIWAK